MMFYKSSYDALSDPTPNMQETQVHQVSDLPEDRADSKSPVPNQQDNQTFSTPELSFLGLESFQAGNANDAIPPSTW